MLAILPAQLKAIRLLSKSYRLSKNFYLPLLAEVVEWRTSRMVNTRSLCFLLHFASVHAIAWRVDAI